MDVQQQINTPFTCPQRKDSPSPPNPHNATKNGQTLRKPLPLIKLYSYGCASSMSEYRICFRALVFDSGREGDVELRRHDGNDDDEEKRTDFLH